MVIVYTIKSIKFVKKPKKLLTAVSIVEISALCEA